MRFPESEYFDKKREEETMRIIGIDFGDARVGVAASDETEILASAVCSLNVTGVNDAVKKCAAKIAELGGEKIICGLPYIISVKKPAKED